MAEDFTQVLSLYFKFKKHIIPKYDQAHTHLSDSFSSYLDIDDLFEDGATRTQWKDDALQHIRDQIKTKIVELACPPDSETLEHDTGAINTLITSLPINTRAREGTITIRSTKDLIQAFKATIRDTTNKVLTIQLHIDQLHFKPHFRPLNISEWGIDEDPAWKINNEAPTDVPADQYTMKHAVRELIDCITPTKSIVENRLPGAKEPSTAPIDSLENFNYKALPGDVQSRYQAKQNRELVTGSSLIPFATDIPSNSNPNINMKQLYYLDPPVTGDRLITKDGTYFHLRDQGGAQEKLFIQNTPICSGKSPSEVRAWYMAFTVHAASKGYYIHPYFCFRRESMNSTYGFSAGIDDDYTLHDLPIKLAPNLEIWSQKIYQAISNDKVFPKGVCDFQRDIIINHYGGRGYEALLAIIRGDLPIFQSHPSKYIRDVPRQRPRETLDRYYFRYIDYLQLRAHLKDITMDLNHKGELDDFIQGTLHAETFIRLTREDRKSKDPHVLLQFSQSMILNTLTKILKEDILPNQKKSSTVVHGSPNTRPVPTSRYRTPRTDRHTPGNARNRTPKLISSIHMDPNNPLASLVVPDDLGRLSEYVDNYSTAVINNINKDPRTFDITKPCLVCEQTGHTFENCSVLNNIPFLQRHYISWKIYLAKEHKRQTEAMTNKQINQLEYQYREYNNEDLDEEEMVFTDNEGDELFEDFQQGEF